RGLSPNARRRPAALRTASGPPLVSVSDIRSLPFAITAQPSGDARIAADIEQAGHVERERRDRLAVGKVAGDQLPDRLPGDALGNGSPARDLVGLVGLHRRAVDSQ